MNHDPLLNEFPTPRPEDLDLSKLTSEEMRQLQESIIARARQFVDPAGSGFAPVMMATDDGDYLFGTDDTIDFFNRLDRVINVISFASRLIGLSILSAGGAIGSAVLITNSETVSLGRGMMTITALFAAGFAISAFRSLTREK